MASDTQPERTLRKNPLQFAPRVGVAYRITDKTVLRAGGGTFYVPSTVRFLDGPTGNPVNQRVNNIATSVAATRMARKLIEQDKVDIIVGPLSGSEGIAMRDYSKTIPDKTVINGTSAALETTWVDPSPNFFRFTLDGAQWGSGLGAYVVNKKGWKRMGGVLADYSFGYTNFLGFAVDFCKAGGEIVERLWVPLGSGDYAGVIAKLPDNVDAIYLGVGGTDAINFLNQYQQAGGKANLIGGSIMADPTVLSSKGKAKDALVGTPTSGPFATDNPAPEWQSYVKAYQDAFPADKRFPTPTLFGATYHVATLAMIAGLNEVKGDLSDGRGKPGRAVQTEATDPVRHRHAQREPSGHGLGVRHRSQRKRRWHAVEQDGRSCRQCHPDARYDAEAFRAMGLPSRTTPDSRRLAASSPTALQTGAGGRSARCLSERFESV